MTVVDSSGGMEATSSVDVLAVDTFRQYLQATCLPLLGEIHPASANPLLLEAFANDLRSAFCMEVLEKFIADPLNRLLQVHCFARNPTQVIKSSGSTVESDQLVQASQTYRVRVNVGVEYSFGNKQSHEIVCFIKRFAMPIVSVESLSYQLQVLTLGLGKKSSLLGQPSSSSLTSSTSSSISDTTEDEEMDHRELLYAVYNVLHQSFTPLVDEYSKFRSQEGDQSVNTSDGTRGIPAIKKKMRELEVALLQYQQNIEIPEVNLVFHPEIQRAADLMRDKGGSINFEVLGLEERINDVTFLNEIQAGVNRWVKEIQKVTRLKGEPISGTATQEIHFWYDLNRALQTVQTKLSSREVELTMALLKRAKRFLATTSFESNSGVAAAQQVVTSVMTLMKDFPINAILSATDIRQVNDGITAVFMHMKKIRVSDEYKLDRLTMLIELISSDVAQQVLSLLRGYNLIQIQYDQFDQIVASCRELFSSWHTHLAGFYEMMKEVSKRRGSMNEDKLKPLADFRVEHAALEERVLKLAEFREQHEKLRQVIDRVLKSPSTDMKNDGQFEITDDVLTEINAAYYQLNSLDALDVSEDGNRAMDSFLKSYSLCIERVEGRIASSLSRRLSATSNADEMFRVLSKYNALFFRPRIRTEVQQFQNQLLENVRQDVSSLQAKYRAHYDLSQASRTSKLRDMPPVSGAILWVKQIERKLQALLSRVESVLGVGWEQHTDGKALKVSAEAFLTKINPQLMFDQWVHETASVPPFDLKNIVLNIVTEESQDGLKKKLVVAFSSQIVTLFKEVRNLEWMGYRVPFTIKMIAEDAKSRYPFAMSLDSSLKTYVNSCRRIDPIFEALTAAHIRDIRATIGKTFSKGNEMRWHADGLGDYVTDLASKAERLHDMVEELRVKHNEIQEQLEVIRKDGEFDAASSKKVIERIQGVVDELGMADYSNIGAFVKNLNQLIGGILANKLEATLSKWIISFESRSGSILEPNNSGLSIPFVVPKTYQIILKNQILSLEPSIDDARKHWMQELKGIFQTICSLPKIKNTSLDAGVFGGKAANPLNLGSSLASPRRRSEIRGKQRDPVFRDVISLVPQEVVVKAFSVVHRRISEMQEYVLTWLQYQALWDMDAQRAIDTVGEDLQKWQQILTEIKHERSDSDGVECTKSFGPMTVNYQQVQAQVNVKYDAWHNQFLSHFADLLFNQINSFYSAISESRSELEQQALEAATAQVVAAVTLIQELRVKMPQWQATYDSFFDGERLLKKQRFKLPVDWPSLSNVEGEWESFVQLLDRKNAQMENQLPQLQSKILEEKKVLDQKISRAIADWDSSKPLNGDQVPKNAIDQLMVFDTMFKLLCQEQKKMDAALEALNVPLLGGGGFDNSSGIQDSLARAMDELTGLDEVWKSIAKVWSRVEELQETLWSAVQPRKTRKQLEDFIEEMRRFPARVQQYEAFEFFMNVLQMRKSLNMLLTELKSDAIRERHWKQILRLLQITSAFNELTLRHFWTSSLSSHDQDLKQIIRTAQGEMALDEFLKQLVDYWSNFQLDLVTYQQRCRIIRGWDEMFAKLDEHLNSLQSMKQSPYYRVFAEQGTTWEEKLTRTRAILDFWIDVQRRWVYLEGIFFGSADIKLQLPKEFARFQSVDNEFVSTMKKVALNPLILEVANIPNLYHALERQQDMMGNVQRALGEYLERQRAAFPRFYFVGDEDLLEMIGNSKEPVQIQRHLSKMFAGISSLDLDESKLVIEGMVSKEGESVRFKNPIRTQDDSRINVWLTKVEEQMRFTLSSLLEEAVRSYCSEKDVEGYTKWISCFPAQMIILATQIQWCAAVEANLKASNAEGLRSVLHSIEAMLKLLSERVLCDVKNEERKKYEHLITELVHQKSVTLRLCKANVSDSSDFQWLYHMRSYFFASETDPLKKLVIKVSNASFNYGFEYLGVGERLVQTPLTERCYLTLTQALEFGLGGNPFGPAGTGKTESVKALGSQLGRFVLVFNCDEHFDFQAMGRIFVGLCQVGAWGCFDEFNRLEERVLSAVSQQILAIQSGVATLKGTIDAAADDMVSSTKPNTSTTIELLGKTIRLHPDVGIFVTMNPGYAGRSNLPDNLKQLFRSIAMVAPDRELIAQVMLFSQGITIAEQISAKVVLLFNLCEDQLTKQPHYDFGLRALKSVLVSAGHLKRKLSLQYEGTMDIEMLETKSLIGSICDTILPKLVAHDIPVFETLLKGVFPGTSTQPVQEDVLRERIIEVAEKRDLVPHSDWVEKALQLYQVMHLRHGVMLVGPCGSGKSTAWRVLLEALELFDGKKGEAYVIDPKSLSKEHLYGTLDNTTLEWSDGVFTYLLRQVLNSVRGESEKRHWLVFDGDVDPEWAENLNSVLDDNRLLTLPSGERLEIPPNVWIVMETETLRYATLATVSRCGMVWFSSDTVLRAHTIEYHLRRIREQAIAEASTSLQIGFAESIKRDTELFIKEVKTLVNRGEDTPTLIEECLEYAMGLSHIMDVTELRLLMSMFSLLARGVSRIADYNEAHADFPMTFDHLSQFASKWLVFSILWGFGGSMDSASRAKLCSFVVERFENSMQFPVSSSSSTQENSLLEYEVNITDGEWRPWLQSIPQLDLESHRVLSTDVVVTTVDTIRHVEVLRGWLSQHRPLILCGPPGSGKTMTLTSTLSSLPEFEFASLNFSSGTSPELIMKTFAQYCEYKRTPSGMILAPSIPEKWLVVFCDEINLPQTDRYGTQRVITFLRQLIEQKGFWLGGKNCWVTLQRIQFVGACNPPTDPGRVPLSLRLLRHAPILLVDFPTYPSLKQIYGTFNRALLKLTPTLKSYVQPLTDAMVDVYHKNQLTFTSEVQPHYIYSPRELSRWMRALYEAIEPLEYEIEIEGLVKLVFHEALRLFMDRLVTPNEQKQCFAIVKETLRYHFPQTACALDEIELEGGNPLLFSTWLSKNYTQVTTEEMRKHIEARLRVFYEEELNVPLVVFDSVIDHALRIDRVLRQPLGHLLLVGESGAGKTVLSRFVSWMNGMSVFQIKLTTNYKLNNFDDDLRVVLKRAGCDGEHICFIFDESNVLDSAFLERMNALLASGEVPGLFEDDEKTSLMHSCREAVQRDGVMVENTEEDLFKYFTKQVQRNLHVVFTMNPATGDFQSRTNTSPALFNRCVVDWFGTWNDHALAQVAYEFTNSLDLPGSDTFRMNPDAIESLKRLLPSEAMSGTIRDVVVACIVQFHHAVLQHMRRLQKRHLKANHVSPRDYLEFIRHFVGLFTEKRAQLEEQQLHLNVGVEKLVATREQVAELQAQLSKKEKELQQKEREANEKLQQMLHEQNEAQEKKKDAEVLAADLGQRDVEISKRKKVAEQDLAEAEPALMEAQASVKSIKKAQLDEIRALARPPVAVRMTMEAVAIMLGETSLDWADLRKFIRKDDFIGLVVNFDSEKLTAKQRQVIQKNYVENADEFEYEKVNRASRACGPLYKWVVSQLHYTEILQKIQPLRDEVRDLEQKSSGLRKSFDRAQATVKELEKRIESYKQEYATLISAAQVITNDMAQVNKKVQRSVALLESLLQEKQRWEAGTNEFEAQIATLVGDTLLGAAFLTYIGFLDFQQRKILVQDWRDILSTMGLESRPSLRFVDYLSRPNEQLEWQMCELPADELCYENAIILQRFRRFPLIIDPSGQAFNFIMRYYSARDNTKINQTSFLDSSFMKVLASAIRFGTALLVHDVENIDPILNPVLNRELYKTGGRVLIRLGGEEIDYSPDFRLFMITRDPSCRFSPDIASRVTFVNFTVTPSSLESQGLSILMKSEQPDTEERRTKLLKLQGEFEVKLRELEESLLQQINKVQGNILDDDSVINALENTKAEAAMILKQAEENQAVMRQVEAAANLYRPLARACSRLFFTLENLSSVHFLYQYSLTFFLNLLAKVLSIPHEKAQQQVVGQTRLDGLSTSFFRQIAGRVSRGLAESDKITFALRLAQIFLLLQYETSPFAADGVPPSTAKFDMPSEDEAECLEASHVPRVPEEQRNEFKRLLPSFSESEIDGLMRLLHLTEFKSCESHVRSNAFSWNIFIRHAAPEKHLPEGWDTMVDKAAMPRRAAFREMILISLLRPDRLLRAAELYVSAVFGEDFPWRGVIELQKNVEEDTEATRAVMLCSTAGFDPSAQIDELANGLQKKYNSVSMGSVEGFDAAEKCMNTALKNGQWLLLRNVHLCPSWLVSVEKRLYNARQTAHKDFRLFLTSEIHPNLPVNLLRMCDILVFEAPSGVKSSMIRSLDTVPAERVNAAPTERARLYLLLAWFHALVHERLRYVPVGWSKMYEFSQSDFRGACDVIDHWINLVGKNRGHISPENIPWTAIRTTLKESVYGGRVDNEFDQELMSVLLESVFTPESYQNTFALVEVDGEKLIIAEGKTKQHFMEWVHQLASTNPPSWLGLPSSAETRLLIEQGASMVRNLQLLQDVYGGEEDESSAVSGGDDQQMVLGTGQEKTSNVDSRPDWVRTLDHRVAGWLEMVPTNLSNLESMTKNFNCPIFRCLYREMTLGADFVLKVTSLLQNVRAVCSYTMKPSNELRVAMRALYKQVLPEQWAQLYAGVGDLSLDEWLDDFSLRIAQLCHFASAGARVEELLNQQDGVWLGGLFAPEAFVTAARQRVAALLNCSLDELYLVAQIEKPTGQEALATLAVSGLQLEGARWSANEGFAPSEVIQNALSTVYLSWLPQSQLVGKNLRSLPVYSNSKRINLLFSVAVEVSGAHLRNVEWTQRSIALVLWQPRHTK